MSEVQFQISTRQKADMLFGYTLPLGAGESVILDTRLILGYDSLAVLSFADQPFSVHLEEACSPDGPFVRTATLASAVGPTGEQVVCDEFFPCGVYGRIVLENTSGIAQTSSRLCVLGVPVP